MNHFEIVKFSTDKIELDVNVSPSEETVWLSKDQMSKLFSRDRSVIARHINNIYKEKELDLESTCAKNAHEVNGQTYYTEIFNLDVIMSVGYRVKSKEGILFRKWSNCILKEYLIKGYIIDESRALINDSNYLALVNKVNSIDKRLSKFENQKIEKEKIFFDGEMFDAKSFLCSLFSKAKYQIVLIDPYADIKALDYLKIKNKSVEVIIYHSSRAKLSNNDIEAFNSQYGGCSASTLEKFHDRFIILDNKELYHIGSSLNFAGKKAFAVLKMDNISILNSIKDKLGYE